MTQLASGNFSMPCAAGMVSIQYSSAMKPGVSMTAQAVLPGRLKREGVDVLP